MMFQGIWIQVKVYKYNYKGVFIHFNMWVIYFVCMLGELLKSLLSQHESTPFLSLISNLTALLHLTTLANIPHVWPQYTPLPEHTLLQRQIYWPVRVNPSFTRLNSPYLTCNLLALIKGTSTQATSVMFDIAQVYLTTYLFINSVLMQTVTYFCYYWYRNHSTLYIFYHTLTYGEMFTNQPLYINSVYLSFQRFSTGTDYSITSVDIPQS
jgi:hypothetical protein